MTLVGRVVWLWPTIVAWDDSPARPRKLPDAVHELSTDVPTGEAHGSEVPASLKPLANRLRRRAQSYAERTSGLKLSLLRGARGAELIVLGPGAQLELSVGEGCMQGLVWLTRRAKQQDQVRRSGELLLFDPRDGCAAVSLPGLPFGRALSLFPSAFEMVCFPSNTRFAITPLTDDDVQIILKFTFVQRVARSIKPSVKR